MKILYCFLYLAGTGILGFLLGRIVPKRWFCADPLSVPCQAMGAKALSGAARQAVAEQGAGHEPGLSEADATEASDSGDDG